MAVQFGIAWSSVIKGVGIVAGGPFYCAQAAAADIMNAYSQPLMNCDGGAANHAVPQARSLR